MLSYVPVGLTTAALGADNPLNIPEPLTEAAVEDDGMLKLEPSPDARPPPRPPPRPPARPPPRPPTEGLVDGAADREAWPPNPANMPPPAAGVAAAGAEGAGA